VCRTQLFKGQGADTNPFGRFDLAGVARISSVVRLPQVGCQEFCCAFCSLLRGRPPSLPLAQAAASGAERRASAVVGYFESSSVAKAGLAPYNVSGAASGFTAAFGDVLGRLVASCSMAP